MAKLILHVFNLFLAVLVGVSASCSTEQVCDENGLQNLEDGNLAFTLDFFSQVAQSKPDTSVIMSPFSVLFPLAQLALYTTGNALLQLLSVLNLSSTDEIRCVIPNLINTYQAQEQVEFDLAGRVYASDQFPLSKPFKRDTRDIFDAEAENLDFSKPQEAADTINSWVEEITRNKITNLVPADVLSPLTRIVLVNAIYFKGNWSSPFNADNTRPQDFYVNSKKTIQVPMMHQKSKFNYYESSELDAKLLEMPYKGGNFSFLVILPNEIDNTYDLLEQLQEDPDLLEEATGSMTRETVIVSLPNFKVETTTDLKDVLENINVTYLFDEATANLTGILEDNTEKLFVSDGIQKALAEINERGSEAAAANAVVVGTRALPRPPPVEFTFKADHPFLFFIRLQSTILFCGYYSG